MNIRTRLGLIGGSVVLVGVLASPISAFGLSSHANAHAAAATAASSDTQATDQTGTAASRQATARLRVCQNHQKVVRNIMARIADRGQKQLDLFSTIATRVENFYTTKGNTLSNYDALVADVNTKKDAAQTTVDTVKTDSTTFSCGDGTKTGLADSFKTDLKAEISALKDYRTSIKNLIVGVKSVNSTTTNTDANSTEGSN